MSVQKTKRDLKELLPHDSVVEFGKQGKDRHVTLVFKRTDTSSTRFDWLKAGAVSIYRYHRVSDALNAFKGHKRWVDSLFYGKNPEITLKNERTGEDYTHLLNGDEEPQVKELNNA